MEWAERRAAFFVDGRDVTAACGLRHDFKFGCPMLIGRRVKGGAMVLHGQPDVISNCGRALSDEEIVTLDAQKDPQN